MSDSSGDTGLHTLAPETSTLRQQRTPEPARFLSSDNVQLLNERDTAMSVTTQPAGENWVITPAPASPFGVPPANIQQQQWMLVLSGVTILFP
jgi:hypothetical protein